MGGDQNPKISIIVLIYRVEPYLRQCLESIVAQTYHNLEILLSIGTNDHDNCEAICDEYALRDERVVLVKSKPQGISAARNLGMRHVTGQYVAFVDGDDWIDPDMMESMLTNIQRNGAQLAICGKWEECLDVRKESRAVGLNVMSSREAFERLLYMKDFGMHIWDKMFLVSATKGIDFPDTKEAEDRYWLYQVMGNVERIVYDSQPKYHFRVRSGSCSNARNNAVISLDADKKMCEYLQSKHSDLQAAAASFLLNSYYSVVYASLVNGGDSKELMRNWLRGMRTSAKLVVSDRKASLANRLKSVLAIVNQQLILLFVRSRIYKYRNEKNAYFV